MENLPPESIQVRPQAKRPVSMALPREDSGMVQQAAGARPATSAAHFADAQSRVLGKPAQKPMKLTNGGK